MEIPGGWRCQAPGRLVLVTEGNASTVAYYAFGFPSKPALHAYKASLRARGVSVCESPSPVFSRDAFAICDPDGNVGVFGVTRSNAAKERAGIDHVPPARLQHVVFRTQQLDAMVRYYEKALGFIVSDRVQDQDSIIRACFLRTDPEHHSFAMFASSTTRLDHHSYETSDWESVRRWADQMSACRVPIVWGVGRHGPGNDLFFMVRDPDDNLVEISAELELCAQDRRAGLWRHEPRTLNLWGSAIMRS